MAVGLAPALILEVPGWSSRVHANRTMTTEVSVVSLHQAVVLHFQVGPGTGEGMTSSLKTGGCTSFHSVPSTCPFLPTYGLQHGNNDSKFNEGGIINAGTGPIPSNTMALQ